MNKEDQEGNSIKNIIIDYGNTHSYVAYKLVQWGYEVSVVDDDADFFEYHSVWIAEKDGKRYAAKEPLSLLGLVAMVQEYGENWEHSDVARVFSVQPAE